MLRIGLLGAAKIAPPAIIGPAGGRADVEITALACRDGDRGRAYADEHGIASVETDYEALARREDVDLIYNALPPVRHADLTIAALEAGKPVLCEKPFAMNSTEAKTMAEAAARTGLPLIEAFHYRFHPAFARLLALVKDGAIGTVTSMDAAFDVAIPYREGELRHTASLGGGALMDLGCYPLHWVRTIAGAEPVIQAATARQDRPGIDTVMSAELQFPGGVPATISCSMADDAKFSANLTLTGEDGTLSMLNPLAPHHGHRISITRNGETETLKVDSETTYHHQLDHVVDVLAGRAQPITGGEDAVANMTAIDAIYAAAGMAPRGL